MSKCMGSKKDVAASTEPILAMISETVLRVMGAADAGQCAYGEGRQGKVRKGGRETAGEEGRARNDW
jgi:hypothetical protein